MIKSFILIIVILLNVAFYTLLERKFLGFIQLRKGPTMVGPLGILQPFADGLKLIIKESTFSFLKEFMMKCSPIFFFFLSIFLWMPVISTCSLYLDYTFLYFLSISSVMALLIFFSGWASSSSFSFLGGVRASAQMISYEIIMAFIILCPLLFYQQFSLFFLTNFFLLNNFFPCFFLIPLFLMTILAETNRAPFDLTEGESELVSGFNTEFSAVFFVFLFLGEYSAILFFSMMMSIFIWNSISLWWLISFIILWVRACFPRKRYDCLMGLMWIFLFPLMCYVVFLFMLFFCF